MKDNTSHSAPISESQLIAYINGELSISEKAAVEKWIHSSEENKKQFNQLEKTWILSGKISPKPVVVDVNTAWAKVNSKIHSTPKKGTVLRLNTWIKVAVAALVLVGAFVLYNRLNNDIATLTLSAKNEIVSDTLEDGSVISLNKNSTLTYPEQFASNERRMTLSGEAFFEVQRDAERPFIIELSHESQVTVLGTSFNIEEKDSTTEVYVKTGKVEFKSSHSAVILTPGEKGILDHSTGEIQKASTSQLEYNETYWLDQKLEFDDMPLQEVLHILSIQFDQLIELEKKESGNCRLNTSFERESLEQILDIIASSFDMTVQKTENGYRLMGHGC